ncbi:MAG: PQQ-binding-like beta-propeller repeat protein [Verrucomicrobiales bacterium]|nr:PQQ-binding-like beta-propeller repeat protein [Verrucomicrobiales bacterium]
MAACTRRRTRLLARLVACGACLNSLCLTAQEPQLTTVWARDFNGDGLSEVSRIEGTWIEYVGGGWPGRLVPITVQGAYLQAAAGAALWSPATPLTTNDRVSPTLSEGGYWFERVSIWRELMGEPLPPFDPVGPYVGVRFVARDGPHAAWVNLADPADFGWQPEPGAAIRVGDKPEPPPAPPEILEQPSGTSVPVGSPLTLSLKVTGYPFPTLQWYLDGQAIPGAMGNVLSVASARLTDAGEYHATASNVVGTVTSQTARVVIGYTLVCSGHRSGDVRSDPSLEIYEPGQLVKVTAIPRAGQTFLRWEGDAEGTTNPLTLTMDGHKSVVAFFTPGLGDLKWQFVTGGAVHSSPALGVDGTVYVGSSDRKLYALDGATGQKLWEFETGGGVESSPAVGAEGTVYVGSHDGSVYAVDGVTGLRRWQFLTGSNVVSSPAIGVDGTVFVGSNDRRLYALNGSTGQKVWEFLTGGEVGSSPALGLDGTVYVGSSDTRLYALAAASGQVKWEFTAGGAMGSPILGADGTVYVVSNDSVLHALNGVTGQQLWELAGAGSRLAIEADGTLYVGANETGFWALDGKTGQKRWETMGLEMYPEGSTSVAFGAAAALGADGMVYVTGKATVCALDGPFPWPQCGSYSVVHALDGTTGQAAWGGTQEPFDFDYSPSSPNIGPDGTVYFGSADGRVHAYQGSSGLAESPWPKFRADVQNTGRVRPPPPLRLAISRHEGKARIAWTTPAVLQSSDALVPADWQDLSEAGSPYDIEPADGQRFYRLRRPRRMRGDMHGRSVHEVPGVNSIRCKRSA